MMKAILFATSLASCWALTPAAASAQTVDSWTAIQQLQADLNATNFETIDDTKADAFFTESVAVEREKLAVRERNVPKVRAVLPATKAARFFQKAFGIDVGSEDADVTEYDVTHYGPLFGFNLHWGARPFPVADNT